MEQSTHHGQSVFQVQYVHDFCEKNIEWTYGSAEPAAILSSFAFLGAWVIGSYILNQKAGRYGTPLRSPFANNSSGNRIKTPLEIALSCLDTLLIVTFLSAVHHAFLTWQSQIVDQIGVLQAQVAYFQSIRKLNKMEWYALISCIILGNFHPAFPGLMMFYLFYKIDEGLLEHCKEFPNLKTATLVLLALNLAGVLFGVLDFYLCTDSSIFGLHSLSHILLALYCLIGALIVYDVKTRKGC